MDVHFPFPFMENILKKLSSVLKKIYSMSYNLRLILTIWFIICTKETTTDFSPQSKLSLLFPKPKSSITWMKCLLWFKKTISIVDQGCQTHLRRGPLSLKVAFKGPNVIFRLYKCNYSLIRGKELRAAAR